MPEGEHPHGALLGLGHCQGILHGCLLIEVLTIIDKPPRRLLEEWWQWAKMVRARLQVCDWLAQRPVPLWKAIRTIAKVADASLHDLLWQFPVHALLYQNLRQRVKYTTKFEID